MFHSIEEALEDLKDGKMIIVVDDENRENEGDLVALAEYATPENINFMATHARGLICTPITEKRALELQLHPMVSTNTDHHQTAFTVSIDHASTSTGISAFERSQTVLQLLDGAANADDFKRPGHVFPLVAKKNGVLERPGHTEAAVDLAKACGAIPAGIICEIMGDSGKMSTGQELMDFAKEHQLKIITIESLIHYRYNHEKVVTRAAKVQLPTSFGQFTMVGYENELDNCEHVALVKGEVNVVDAPIVRIHSSCLTGDIFHSERCDCGPQLQEALSIIEKEGTGIVLYMQQEGRGIGLINKLRTYELQEQDFDTVDANLELGFPADARDYALAVQMLQDLGISKVRLLTNNPDKVQSLEAYGIEVVERLPIEIVAVESNSFYLETKKEKMNHLIS
ncbi:bifunctional 3,4-dihydroxy-2-butanone-4-phosphate synthase/GTP cyclohydrolase II [Viridibacillus sp. NPDC096237]|uniref:bifunctional 3,4-dihydroxy-2-butanone-4-phosphate synthase/GTP cyclohydrolase II n=1 Tax=Viridibacillus sp. NPDC096237 TaxID=3390721 RepID=UPI003D0486A8